MPLVERFANFIDWPISQRAVLLGVLGLVATSMGAVVNLVVHLTSDQAMWDLAMINRFMGAWLGIQFLATLINLYNATMLRAVIERLREGLLHGDRIGTIGLDKPEAGIAAGQLQVALL